MDEKKEEGTVEQAKELLAAIEKENQALGAKRDAIRAKQLELKAKASELIRFIAGR